MTRQHAIIPHPGRGVSGLIVGAIYATLKHRGLLPPEYSWPAIIRLSTVCFWLPIVGG